MPDDVKKEEVKVEKDKTLLWMSYGDVAKIFLGLIVGLVLAWLNSWLNAKSPVLNYTVASPISFDNSSVVSINITNSGAKEADDVVFVFKAAGRNITDVRIEPDALKATKDKKDGSVTIDIKMLNVGETAEVAMVMNRGETPFTYQATLRGRGVTGTEGSNLEKRLHEMDTSLLFSRVAFSIMVVQIAAIMIFLFYFTNKIKKRILKYKSTIKELKATPPSPTTADAPKTQLPMD